MKYIKSLNLNEQSMYMIGDKEVSRDKVLSYMFSNKKKPISKSNFSNSDGVGWPKWMSTNVVPGTNRTVKWDTIKKDMKRFEKKYGKGNVVVNGRTNGGDPVVDIYSKSINDSKVNEESSLHKRFNKMVNNNLEDVVEILIQLDKIEYTDEDKLSYYEIHANQIDGAQDIKDSLTDYSDKKLKDILKAYESKIYEAKKFKPGDMWSNDFDYDGMLKYALTVNHKTPLKTLNKLHASATDVNYHTPFSGLGNAIDWITDDGANSSKGKDFMKQFHNDIKDEIKSNA